MSSQTMAVSVGSKDWNCGDPRQTYPLSSFSPKAFFVVTQTLPIEGY